MSSEIGDGLLVDKGKLEKLGEGMEGMTGKGIKSLESIVVPFEKGKTVS